MQMVETDGTFQTRAITTDEPMDEHRARELMELIAEGTHICGDPGVQYDTTINKWHTCPNSGPINASNPCSEYMFIDDSACNLASLNLMKFRRADGTFDAASFERAVRIMIIAQELLVDHGSYPTEKITQNSHDFRPLGLGYANLGSLVMSLGLAYDSEQARNLAGAISAIMTGRAYAVSAELAKGLGTFEYFEPNRESMLRVIAMHRNAVRDIDINNCPDYLLQRARQCWDEALQLGKLHGYRNAQVSVLAPTGTIGFMMDCDTTGIEPDIALVKYKLLAGGGMLKIVNNTVRLALEKLGYTPEKISHIIETIEQDDTIETAEMLDERHLPVFDCAFKPAKGQRSIHYLAHIRMMAAVQSFISGAISKTINMPQSSTVAEIMSAYMTGWKLGLKALAIYRDGSKRSQPVTTKKQTPSEEKTDSAELAQDPANRLQRRPQRIRLSDTRNSITHKFDVGGHEGYLTVGLYEDGTPGELFITMAKEGSTVGGLMDAFGTCISMALQYGVPLGTLVDKFSHSRFEPAGMTTNRDIPFAKSLIDYISRWLGMTFLPGYREANAPKRPQKALKKEDPSNPPRLPLTGSNPSPKDGNTRAKDKDKLAGISNRIEDLLGIVNKPAEDMAAVVRKAEVMASFNQQFSHFQSDAPVCDSCGSITVRNGNCYRCHNCGSSMGCS